jgi:hypothetical protein
MGEHSSVYTNGGTTPVAYTIIDATSTIRANLFMPVDINRFVGTWKGKVNNEDVTVYITADSKWITVGKARGTYTTSGNKIVFTMTDAWETNDQGMKDWKKATSSPPYQYNLTLSSDGNTLTGSIDGNTGTFTRSVVGDGVPKTLVITSIPASVYAYGKDGGGIGVFPAGTSKENALQQKGVVAGVGLEDDGDNFTAEKKDDNTYTLTLQLHIIGAGDIPWTGTGPHDVYVALFSNNVGHYYKASATFSAATTTIEFSSAPELTLQQP